MIIIIGLGNPGEKYQSTRHNVGFMFLDKLAEKFNFSDFKLSKKFHSQISEGEIAGQKVILAKPETFMNESGIAVETLTGYYKTPLTDILVVHDEMDIPLGNIKIVKGRGSAGHKGVKSIIEKIGDDFARFRVGIGPETSKKQDTEKFVIDNFSKKETVALKHTFKKTTQALEDLLTEGLEKAMNKYNQ